MRGVVVAFFVCFFCFSCFSCVHSNGELEKGFTFRSSYSQVGLDEWLRYRRYLRKAAPKSLDLEKEFLEKKIRKNKMLRDRIRLSFVLLTPYYKGADFKRGRRMLGDLLKEIDSQSEQGVMLAFFADFAKDLDAVDRISQRAKKALSKTAMEKRELEKKIQALTSIEQSLIKKDIR